MDGVLLFAYIVTILAFRLREVVAERISERAKHVVNEENRTVAWHRAIKDCGLTPERPSSRSEQSLCARLGTSVLTLSRYSDGGQTSTKIFVTGRFGVSLKPEDDSSALAKTLGATEIEIGDPRFDSTFFIGGPPARVFAVLDAETRARLLNLRGLPVSVTATSLEVRAAEGGVTSAVPGVLRLVVDLVESLTKGGTLPDRLAANALYDPVPTVRLRNLLLLIREFSEHPVTRETLRIACQDPSSEIRLRAATALGNEGEAVLLQLVEHPESDHWSALAIAALGRRLSFEGTKTILENALRVRRIDVAKSCLQVLGQQASPKALTLLLKVLAVEHEDLAVAAVTALGATNDEAAEPALIAALARDDVRAAAAEALGHVGTGAAVLPLKEASAQHSSREFRKAAREAIAAIQARLSGASPGQLSLAAGEAGQLSIATPEAGQVTLASSDVGHLSLPDPPDRDPKSR